MKVKIQDATGVSQLAYKLLALVLIIFILYTLRAIFVPLVFAGLLACILLPLCEFLEKIKIPKTLAIILSIVFAMAILVGVLYVMAIQISSLDELLPILNSKFDLWLNQIQVYFKSNFNLDQSKIIKEGQKSMSDILKNGSSIVSNILGTLGNFLVNLSLMPLYIFLFLLYRDFLKEFIYRLFNTTLKHKLDVTIDKMTDIMGHYISGLLKVILIVGILNTAALLLLGIDHAVFFGFFASFLVLIPYIGIALGAILPILVALLTKDSYWYAIGVAGAFYGIQFLEGNFITPYIVGNKISINPLIAIISLLLFGTLWDLSGLVLALPLTAMLKVVFDSSEGTQAWGFLLGDVERE